MTIDYNLAKQLKDAGFPQEGSGLFHSVNGNDTYHPTKIPCIDKI